MTLTPERHRSFPPRRRYPLPALLALVLLAGCGMVDRMSGVSTAKDLQATGVAAPAEILRIWDTGITVNKDPVIGMDVLVRPTDRPPYEAKIEKSLISRLDVPQFQPGKVIQVRFDPKEPGRVAIDVYRYK
ncbi:MAG: hypothetical protein QOJ16_4848 [Acidobacteriota bacterium]|jgi:hypothetical protein|nr:hypothetical protein [Acidobacteriota bacterium]